MLDKHRMKKAYVELNEVINNLSEFEREMIPDIFIVNMHKKMDQEYNFQYDTNKSILEQELMPETQSLIVQIYKRYLCPESEKSGWREYDRLCHEKLEKEKREKYNPDDIFKNNTIAKEESVDEIEGERVQMIEYKEENILIKLISKIKNFFQKYRK